MKKLRIRQVRSAINEVEGHKLTLRALGIRRLHRPVVHADTPQIRGMIRVVHHLVRVEEISEA
jgi:large subunit ribosomal protein L30